MRLSKKIVIPLFFAVVLLATAAVWNDDYFFAVKEVELQLEPSPLHRMLQVDVRKRIMSKLDTARDKNIWQVPLQKLRENILSDVWIESATIERDLPQKIRVEVKIKEVVFVYVDKRGRLLPVSEKGQLLNPIEFDHTPDVPVIRNADVVNSAGTLATVIELFRNLPREGLLSQQNVAEIDWSPVSGLKVELVSRPNSTIEDGKIILGIDQVHLKAKRVANVLKYLESQKQKWRVIDASFSKKVLVRLRKHS